jgi:LAO/AO transport system kinase
VDSSFQAPTNVDRLIEALMNGHRLSLARAISKIENRDQDLAELIAKLYPKSGSAQVIGITGPPGAGKSTLVDQLTGFYRKQNKKVAVVAVDPSSPFTGGAILGDRIRMQKHTADEGVFIRSLGTRGKHGGLSHATKEVVMCLDAAGFDLIIVETAGVGQTELDILKLSETVVVILVPEAGDSIQMMKAGLMEIADLFVVNKSDRPEADKIVRELTTQVGMNPHNETSWIQPILKTEAHKGVGVESLAHSLHEHQVYLKKSGQKAQKQVAFLKSEVLEILTERLDQSLSDLFKTTSGEDILQQMVSKKLDPYSAADLLSLSPKKSKN